MFEHGHQYNFYATLTQRVRKRRIFQILHSSKDLSDAEKLMNSNWLGLISDSINVRYFSKKLFTNGTNTWLYPGVDLTTLWGIVGCWFLKLFSIHLWCAPIYQYNRKDYILVRQRFQFHWSNKQPTIIFISIEDEALEKFIYASGTKWIFNPPHSSHFGWVWKKMMGLVRKIVYPVLMEPSNQNITHDILCISVTELITSQLPTVYTNAIRPYYPFVLTPNVLLTRKHSLFLFRLSRV